MAESSSAERRPDAVIMDLRMPLVDGFGLLYRIRSREAQQHIPVLVVTGDTTLTETTLGVTALKSRYRRCLGTDIEVPVQLLAPRPLR